MSTQAQGRILVIRGGAIGDFILTLPVLSALRAQFPAARLELMGYPHVAQLALATGLVTEIRSIEARAMASFFTERGELNTELSSYFARFAVIVSFLYDPDDVFKDNIAKCGGAQFVVAQHRPDEAKKLHATEVFLQGLERLAIFDADPVPRLDLPVTPETMLPAGRWLAVHPGSGGEHKNWPEGHWTDLLTQLVATTHFNVLLVGGEAEGGRLKRLEVALPHSRAKVLQSAPLTDVARRIKQCVAFVGHDSGITHLAAAVGLPGLVLWGDTVEEVWRPRSERMIIVRKPKGLVVLSVSDVLCQLTAMLKGL